MRKTPIARISFSNANVLLIALCITCNKCLLKCPLQVTLLKKY